MDIAKEAFPGDTTIEQNGLKLFLEQQAGAMLANATIDFNEMQGFVLNNAQPSSSCGTCSC